MCGRFGFDMPTPALEELFDLHIGEEIPPSFNITPGQPILATALFEGRRELMGFHWGLVPAWAKEIRNGYANARSETVFEKASFKDAVAYHRCLVPASFYYEWKKTGTARIPHAIMLRGMAPLGMAGIYSEHEQFGPTLALLTCKPNKTLRPIHDRMPVIIAPKNHEAWLAPHTHRDDLESLMAPYSGPMTAHAVSTRVNSPANNDRKLIHPTSAQNQLPI